MSKSPETITVETTRVACDGLPAPMLREAGGNNDLGHPRVYLTLQNGEIECPYCSRKYVLAEGAHAAAH